MKTIAIETCAASLLVALAAWAAPAEELPVRSTRGRRSRVRIARSQSDRKISRNEAHVKGSVSKRFDGIDSDGDGYLSKLEFAARPSAERFE